jgi:hypothetical protein
VSHADSVTFSLTSSQQGAITSTAAGDITGHMLAYLFSADAQSNYAAGLAAFTTGEFYQALGNLNTADSYYATAQTDFNNFAKDIGASSFSFVPAPEPGILLLMAMGIAALFVVRCFKPSIDVKSAA